MTLFVHAGPWEPDRPKFSQGRGVIRELDNMVRLNGQLCATTALLPFRSDGFTLPTDERAIKMETLTSVGTSGLSLLITNEKVRQFQGMQAVSDGMDHGISSLTSVQTAAFGPNLIIANTTGFGVFVVNASTFTAVEWPSANPTGRALGIVGDRLLVGGVLNEDNSVYFSAINNWEQFNSVEDSTAGKIDYAVGGRALAIVGGENGIIFCENSIYRVLEVQEEENFVVQNISPDIGLFGPNALYRVGRNIYFLSESGFKVLNQDSGINLTAIGYGRVDSFVFSGLGSKYPPIDAKRRAEINCYHDYARHQIVWVYPTTDDRPNQLSGVISYNYEENEWGRFNFEEDDPGADRVKAVQAVGSLREAPLFADQVPDQSDTGEFSTEDPDNPNFGAGGRRIFVFDLDGQLRYLSDTIAVREFGCQSSTSDIQGLFNPPPNRSRSDPPSPPTPEPPVAAGHMIFLNEARLAGAFLYGGAKNPNAEIFLRITLEEYIDPESGFESGPVEMEFKAIDTGCVPFEATAYRIGLGFRARNQKRVCSFAGWNISFMDAGIATRE